MHDADSLLQPKDHLAADREIAEQVAQVAQRCRHDARVVYVDHDPIVLVHARALLADRLTAVAAGDVRDPHALLADPVVRGHLDLRQPVAVLLTALLHVIDDRDGPRAIVAAFRDALVPPVPLLAGVARLPESDPGTATSIGGSDDER